MKGIYDTITKDIYIRHASSIDQQPQYHTHNVYEIYLLITGNIYIYVESKCFHLKNASLLLIQPGEYHRLQLIDESVYERFTLNISQTYLDSCSTNETNLAKCFYDRIDDEPNLILLNDSSFSELLDLFQLIKQNHESDSYGHDCMSQSYILQLLVKINLLNKNFNKQTVPNIMPPLVTQTLKFIDSHLTEDLSLQLLSDELFHNGVYISRCFKKITGLSIQQYIFKKRISLSQKYLKEGYSVTDSCTMSGFNNYSNFSRSFSQVVGLSPKKYQDRCAQQI